MKKKEFGQMTESGLTLLDGATGSNLRKMGMPVGICAEKWALENSDAALSLMRGYVNAGSDVIYAPTFSANRIGLGMYGLEDHVSEFNEKLVALAKRAAGDRALVAGDMTTTGRLPETEDARALSRMDRNLFRTGTRTLGCGRGFDRSGNDADD